MRRAESPTTEKEGGAEPPFRFGGPTAHPEAMDGSSCSYNQRERSHPQRLSGPRSLYKRGPGTPAGSLVLEKESNLGLTNTYGLI